MKITYLLLSVYTTIPRLTIFNQNPLNYNRHRICHQS